MKQKRNMKKRKNNNNRFAFGLKMMRLGKMIYP